MEWNVYYYSMNERKIKQFNIFNHSNFKNEVIDLIGKIKDRDEFSEEIKKVLFYYFGFKAEYEVVISPWCGGNDKDGIKVDIYSQVMLNWDKFVDYVWNYRD